MVFAEVIQAARLEMCNQRREEVTQEAAVFLTHSVGVPAKDALVLAVHGSHDLRCVLCSPLSEEVRDLKVFYTRAVANVDPTVEQGKVKAENSVLDERDILTSYCGMALLCKVIAACEPSALSLAAVELSLGYNSLYFAFVYNDSAVVE